MLGLIPFFYKINIKISWENGVIIPEKVINMDLDQFYKQITDNVTEITSIAINRSIPTPQTVPLKIVKDFTDILSISLKIGYKFELLDKLKE